MWHGDLAKITLDVQRSATLSKSTLKREGGANAFSSLDKSGPITSWKFSDSHCLASVLQNLIFVLEQGYLHIDLGLAGARDDYTASKICIESASTSEWENECFRDAISNGILKQM